MDLRSNRCPLLAALAAFATFDCSDKELREMLSWLGGGSSGSNIMKMLGEEEFWQASGSKDNTSMLVSPVSTSMSMSFVPSNFSAWATQGPDDAEYIQSLYILFVMVDISKVEKLLGEFTGRGGQEQSKLLHLP